MNHPASLLPLAGRTALITGASRGIGHAIAVGFARAGANVAVNYLTDETAARHVTDEIAALGVRTLAVRADIGRLQEHEELLAEVTERLGPLHILVNNAAVEPRGPILDADEAQWDHTLAVNLKGIFFLTQQVARAMIGADLPGRIINLASTHESRPLERAALYAISKGGLAMLTKSFAQELACHRITVNALVPGAIRTELNRAVLADPAYEAKVVGRIPLGRIGDTADLVAAAVFLASDASAYMTGTAITIDGGLSL